MYRPSSCILQHEGLHLGNDLDVRPVVVIEELPHFIHIHATASVCQIDVVDLHSHNIVFRSVRLGLMIERVPSTLQHSTRECVLEHCLIQCHIHLIMKDPCHRGKPCAGCAVPLSDQTPFGFESD